MVNIPPIYGDDWGGAYDIAVPTLSGSCFECQQGPLAHSLWARSAPRATLAQKKTQKNHHHRDRKWRNIGSSASFHAGILGLADFLWELGILERIEKLRFGPGIQPSIPPQKILWYETVEVIRHKNHMILIYEY